MPSRRLRVYGLVARATIWPILAYMRRGETSRKLLDLAAALSGRYPKGTIRHEIRVGGRSGQRIGAAGLRQDRVILYFHGGAYFSGSSKTHGPMLAQLARDAGCEVIAQDYRLVLEAPFPAAFDDAVAAWIDLRGQGFEASQIVLAGDSAGGGLGLALLAHVLSQGETPAGVLAFSPWTDLTHSGQTVRTNARRDAMLPASRTAASAASYLAGADPTDHRASPHFATFKNPPPAMIQVGDQEILLDDARRMAAKLEAAGGEVRLDVWDGAQHVWQLAFGFVPEAAEALKQAGGWVQETFEKAMR
ncbi:MAG TPA: alpha/beta hydrolase [Paracoccaceae bacterium]|nr:alpha/beta hydrolase [Paracoccaceae bacterium]